MIKNFLSLLAILAIFIQPVFPEIKAYPENFRHFTPAEGFYNDKVTSLVQDNDGFIWTGTIAGLLKFNGLRFEPVNIADKDAARVVNGNIQQLFKDKAGNIWIGANTGLCIYNPSVGQFIKVRLPAGNDYFVTSVSQGKDNAVFVCTNKGLYKISPDGLVISTFDFLNGLG